MVTDKRLQEALRQLVRPGDAAVSVELPAPAVRPPIAAGAGAGRLKPRQTAQQQQDPAPTIASLTEVDATARTFHPDRTVTTSDGIFSFVYRRLHATDMVTDTGTVIPFEYGDPDA